MWLVVTQVTNTIFLPLPVFAAWEASSLYVRDTGKKEVVRVVGKVIGGNKRSLFPLPGLFSASYHTTLS